MLARLRAHHNGILRPFARPSDCAAALLGIQSQILHAAYISIFSRTQSTHFEQLQQALLEEKTLINAWGQRATLHLYCTQNWLLWVAAQRNRRSWFQKNYSARKDDFDALKADLLAALNDKSQFHRGDLRAIEEVYGEEALSAWGGILISLSFEGRVCNLGRTGNQTLYGYVPNWLDDAVELSLSVEEANVRLMEAYFRHYGPATFADFCHWRGATRKQAEPWWAAVRERLVEQPAGYYQHPETIATDYDDTPFSRLLYRFDPLLLSYKDKSWLVPKELEKAIWQKAAHVNGIVLQEEGAVAVWNYQKKNKKQLDFEVKPFRQLQAAERARMEREMERIAAFWERAVGTVDYAR